MNYKKYSTYSIESFLEDENFRSWIISPNVEKDRFWKVFIVQYPEQEANLKQARELMQQMNEYFLVNRQDFSTTEEKFRLTLLSKMEEAKSQKKIMARRRKISRRLVAAASFALLLVTVSWLFLKPSDHYQTIATDYGEWKTLELPDGSVVELNANSEIRLAEPWNEDTDRKVWLKGEAFFKVAKKPATGAKFQVITEGLTIEVLGTSFNVHNRGEETNVFLEEGKIKLDLGTEEEYLDPGDFIAYSATKNRITQRYQSPAEAHTSWKDGSLILKDTPVQEILDKLEEIYGLTIIVENKKILGEKKTVAVPMNKIELAIPILESTLGTSIRKLDNQLIIK